MILRFQSFLTGLLALMMALTLGLAFVQAKPALGGYQLFEQTQLGFEAPIQLASLGNFYWSAETASDYAIAPNRTDDVFETGANITPNSTLARYTHIGADGTFVTETGSIANVIGRIPDNATEIRITRQKADQLEVDLGLNPGSLEANNTLTLVDDISSRCPRCPIGGNDQFLGGGQGLPGGGAELALSEEN